MRISKEKHLRWDVDFLIMFELLTALVAGSLGVLDIFCLDRKVG